MYDELAKNLNAIQADNARGLVKNLNMKQKLVKMKRKYLIMILVNILLLKNLIR